MLSLDQISKKIDDLEHDRISLDEFEDWFSVESWNVHDHGDENLSDVVFSLESVFSRYYDGKVKREKLSQELANALGSSASLRVVKVHLHKPAFVSTKPQDITLRFGARGLLGVQIPDHVEESVGSSIRQLSLGHA